MIRMKSFWIIACLLAMSVSFAFGQGGNFKFVWTPNFNPNWSALRYECDAEADTLHDGVVVRLFHSEGFNAPNPATDLPLVVGSAGAAGEVDPTNEFVFNSEAVGQPEGSFNSDQFFWLGGTPGAFYLIYLQIGRWEGEDWCCLYYSHRMSPTSGYKEYFVGNAADNLFGDPIWTCYEPTCLPEPIPCLPPPAVTGFDATDDECPSVHLTWDPYDPDTAAFYNVDSLILYQQNTQIGMVHWTATSFDAYPTAGFSFNFKSRVRRWCGDVSALSVTAEDVGERLIYPTGTPTIQSATNDSCGYVKVVFLHGNYSEADSVALLRNGEIVAKKLTGFVTQRDSIYHRNAPAGQALYSLAPWNEECGIGTASSTLQGEALQVPDQVQNVNASDNDCSHPSYVLITWSDVATETGYRVFRDGTLIATKGAGVTSHNDNPGDDFVYPYTVLAFNGCGNGQLSDSNNGSLPTDPNPPSNVQATDNLCDRITVTWNDESTIETGFAVFKLSPAPAETAYVNQNVETYDYMTATPGETYSFTVAPGYACGFGTPGNTDTGMQLETPDPVTDLAEGTSTCDYAQITWTDNSSTEAGFIVKRDGDSVGTAAANSEFYNDFFATPGTPHNYSVYAYNVCGEATSPSSETATRLPMPDTPQNFSATNDQCGFVACGWDAVTGVTGYTVYRDDGSARTVDTFVVDPDSNTYTDDTALAGVIYTYWVTATNSCGNSGNSNTDDGEIQPLPGQAVLAWDSVSCDAIFMCWNTIADADTYWILQDGISIDWLLATDDTCRSFDPGDTLEYDYSIVATNACGAGDTSTAVTLAKRGLPSGPMQFGPEPANCDNVTISWSSDSEGQDGFYIYINMAPYDTVGASDTFYVDTEVEPGELRSYQLHPFNVCGSIFHGEIGQRRLAPPDSVEDVVATDDLCGQVTITWTDPESSEEGFKIVRDDMIARTVDTVATIEDPDVVTYDDMTAQSGTWYEYTVYAYNECGLSEPSVADSGVVLPLPDAVTGFRATEECSLIVFNWDVSEFAESYRVYQDLATLIATVPDTFFAWDDLGQHNWHVIPANTCGAGVSSDTLNRTALTAPEAIADLMANEVVAREQVDNCDHVTLTWTDPVNADTIFIYRDDILIDTVLAGIETYLDDELAPADYEYYVIAANQCGESDESDHVNATVFPPATVPQNVAASDTSCSAVYVVWDASTGTFDEYVVYRDSEEIARVPAGGDTFYVHTTAEPGVAGDYQVSCDDDVCGETELSAAAEGLRLPGPTPPTDVAASDTLCNTITVTWTASTGTFSEYRIYRDDVHVGTVDGAVTTYDDTLSTAGTYTYHVTAWSAECGETADSDPDDGTMLPQMGQVIELAASMDDCYGVALGWVGFHAADVYYVYRDATAIDTVDTNEAFDSTAVRGVTYAYTVSAVNRCNEGLQSEAANGMRKDFPPAITNLTASDTLCDEICLVWDDVEEETGYYIYRDTILYDSTETDVTNYCDIDVVAGTTYNYVVRARNECGEGDPSESIPGVGVASLAQPQNVVTTPSCDDVCISWDDIEGETGYQLYHSLNGSDWTELATLDADVVSYCDTGINPGECYMYTVAGINICGVGAESEQVEGCRLDVPIIIPNLVATTDVCDSICLSWDDVGTETSYTIMRNSVFIVTDLPADCTSYCDTDVEPNEDYIYAVRGANECGDGIFSDQASGMAADVPDQVTDVAATSDACSLVTITWTDLTTETGYEIYSGSDPYVLLGTTGMDVATFDAVGFIGADDFSVVATNQCGSGLRSELAAGEGLDVPPAVENLTYELNCRVVTLNWNFAVTADSYKVLRREEGVVEWTAVDTTELISHSDGPLEAGTWEYAILAYNECGDAPDISNIVSVIIIPALETPQNLTATTDLCNCVQLTWDDVENETQYEIYCGETMIATTEANNTDTTVCGFENPCDYAVRAVNECDESELSATATGSYDEVPPIVTGVSASEDDCDLITVIWDPVTVEPIDGYIIYCDGDSVGFVLSIADEEFEHDTLAGTYDYYVRAYNHCGYSDPSATDEGTRFELLDAPMNITASTDRCDGIEIDFDPVPGATSYTIFRIAFPITGITDADLPYLDVPTTPGNYTYTVACVNICGQGFPSSPAVTGTMLESPGTPGSFTASDDMCDTIRFNWTVPTGAVDGYQILCNEVIVATIEDGSQTTYDLTGVGDVTCLYSIIATSTGEGCVSSDPATDEGTSHDVPGPPQNLGTPLTAICDSVALAWEEAEGEVTNYVIYRDDLELEPIGMVDNDVFEYYDSQVDDPYDHEYWVVAENTCGQAVAGPITASILSLFEFEEDIPETVECVEPPYDLDVRYCDNVDSLEIWMSVNGGPFDTLVAVVYTLMDPATIVIPYVGQIMADGQVMVLSYRDQRVDTTYSNDFVIDCTDNADVSDLLIPKEFYLAQNYPNPFNPETTIEFGVPHQALVKIEIFDVLGRRVATPVSSTLEPGIHKILWSCDGCATGMYIVRMVSESKVFHHKMLMLK